MRASLGGRDLERKTRAGSDQAVIISVPRTTITTMCLTLVANALGSAVLRSCFLSRRGSRSGTQHR
jgi:hypothetical protein